MANVATELKPAHESFPDAVISYAQSASLPVMMAAYNESALCGILDLMAATEFPADKIPEMIEKISAVLPTIRQRNCESVMGQLGSAISELMSRIGVVAMGSGVQASDAPHAEQPTGPPVTDWEVLG